MTTLEHEISVYKDGYLSIRFCFRCSKEGEALLDPCEPYATKCHICGHDCLSNEPCKKCNRVKEMFKTAVDKSNSRN